MIDRCLEAVLKIHESTQAEGSFERVFLKRDGDALLVVRATESLALPEGALDAVMARYGRPLDADVTLVDVDALELDGGKRLRHVRHLARYDVIARDFLVLEAPGTDALCALATTVAGALEHLAVAMTRGAQRR